MRYWLVFSLSAAVLLCVCACGPAPAPPSGDGPGIAEPAYPETMFAPKDMSDAAVYETYGASFPTLAFPKTANANGGFDLLEAGFPAHWAAESRAADKSLNWHPLADSARDGELGIFLPLSPRAEGAARIHSAPMEAGPGDVVKFNAWIRPEGAPVRQPAVFVEARVGGEWREVAPVARVSEVQAMNYAGWIPRGRSCIAPAGTEQVRLVIECATDGTAGTGWHVDDFHCEIVSLRLRMREAAGRERLPDVLLLGTDTLRQSPLGCYGNKTNHTPNTDLLAAEGLLFEKVTTASPWTRPSFGSIFTSLYPSQHKAELHLSALPQSVETLAEVMQKRGYFTVGFVRTLFDGFVGPGTGFDQGFDVYLYSDDTEELSVMANAYLDLNGDALREMTGGGVMIFRHLYEPHAEYINHNPELVVNRGLLANVEFTFDVLDNKLFRNDPALTNEEDVLFARKLYDGEAAHMDTRIGETLLRLRHLGLYDKMNIVFFSDHGESFNEKPGAWCHSTPYETCVGVPLILRFPGVTAPGTRDRETLAHNLDIMPTLLGALGIDTPGGLEGRDLLRPGTPPAAHSISEDRKSGYLTVRGPAMKLAVSGASTPRRDDYESIRDWNLFSEDSPAVYELYNLDADPFELDDLAASDPEALQEMKAVLFAHCARAGIVDRETLAAAAPRQLSPERVTALLLTVDTGGAPAPGSVHSGEMVELSPEALEDIRSQGYM